MTFGQAVKQLLYVNDIKMGVLANALGYDISYLSKWVNDIKLPAAKTAESLCDRIASYVNTVSTPVSRAETASKLGFHLNDGASFERRLSDKLYTIYLEQRSPASEENASDNNANIVSGWPMRAEDATKELVDFFDQATVTQLEGIISLPVELLRSNFIVSANRQCADLSLTKTMQLRQIISVEDFSGNVDKYIRYILKHLSLLSPIQVDYYMSTAANKIPSQHPMMILKNRMALHQIDTPLDTSPKFSVLSRNKAVSAEMHSTCLNGLLPTSLLIERLDIYDKIAYSFAVEKYNRYIMPYMGPVRLGEKLLDDFLERYLDVPHMYEFHRKMHQMTQECNYSLITYDSTLIDYINSGRIRLFDGVITISREDRKRHLLSLLEEMDDPDRTCIQILNERNPLLARADNLLTVYINDNATFATSDAPNARTGLFNFVSPQIKQQVETFFTHIEELPDSYIKRGKAASDFIYKAIKLI